MSANMGYVQDGMQKVEQEVPLCRQWTRSSSDANVYPRPLVHTHSHGAHDVVPLRAPWHCPCHEVMGSPGCPREHFPFPPPSSQQRAPNLPADSLWFLWELSCPAPSCYSRGTTSSTHWNFLSAPWLWQCSGDHRAVLLCSHSSSSPPPCAWVYLGCLPTMFFHYNFLLDGTSGAEGSPWAVPGTLVG